MDNASVLKGILSSSYQKPAAPKSKWNIPSINKFTITVACRIFIGKVLIVSILQDNLLTINITAGSHL